jgi:hypothetical protein
VSAAPTIDACVKKSDVCNITDAQRGLYPHGVGS